MDDAGPKRRRGMLGFYVAGFALIALALFGAWFWNVWTNWQFGESEAKRRQAEAARQLGVPVETAIDLGGGVALEFVLIPPGMFDMGSPEDSGPVHRVQISRPFYMGKHEVTQEQWERVMGTNPSHFKGAKLPAEQLFWGDCQEFLRRAGALTRGRMALRLPTEAEWEWACRAGTRTRFCLGDDEARLGGYAWYGANSGDVTHPVGGKQPNAWGLYDCHGNVSEYCADWCVSYRANPWPGKFRWARDPRGPDTGPGRVVRGGSWDDVSEYCCSAARDISDPLYRSYHIGFRGAASVTGP